MGFDVRNLRLGLLIFALCCGLCRTAAATPYLVVDAKTGEVIAQQDATEPWYPASLTKLVSVYVALKAVRDKRVTFDTPFVVSPRAARMPPSKMGFAPGTELTLDNLLKMLLVKSANDLAIVLAEGIDGSVEDFAAEMNATAASLGMRESHFVNPNGLHDSGHYSSARDLAIVALALLRDFPEHADLFDIGALKLGDQIIPTHNGLMGRYPGVDGMKTGFTCPAGFNVVASATQGDRKIIAVVLGYPNAKSRSLRAAALLDSGFHSRGSGVQLGALPSSPISAPPNMREAVCGRHREIVSEDDFPIEVAVPGTGASAGSVQDSDSPAHFFAQQPATMTVPASQLLFARRPPAFEPIPVFLGPVAGWSGPVMQARATPGRPPATSVPASAAAYAPAKPNALGAGSPVAVDPLALPLNRRSAKVRSPASIGASADRAIAEKTDAEAVRSKPKVTAKPTPEAKASASAEPHAAANPGKHVRHARVRKTATPVKPAKPQQHADTPVATPPSGRTAAGVSAQ
jgi:D-alanyl-D-alanine carboxypeptidase